MPLNGLKKSNPNLYSIVIAVGIILVWRGIWGLADLYLFPGNPAVSFLVSIAIGLFLLYINDFRLNELA